MCIRDRVKDDTFTTINNLTGNWEFTHNTNEPTSINETTQTINLGDEHNPLESLVHWNATANYLNGNVVLFAPGGGSQEHILSLYEVIDEDMTATGTAPESSGGTSAGWRLVRAGIVALSTNDGAGDAGLTSNATLRINHGAGVDVTRQQTLFTISTHSTSGSDVNDFRPGWAYSYFNLIDNTTHTGTVGERQTGFEIDAVELIGADTYLHIDFQDPNPFYCWRSLRI